MPLTGLSPCHHTTAWSGGQSQKCPGGKSTATSGLECTDLKHSCQREKKITWIKSNSSGTQSKQIISKLFIKCEPICLSKCQCRDARGNTKRPEEYLGCSCEIYSCSDPSQLQRATGGLKLMDFSFRATLDRVHEHEPRLSSMHPSDSYGRYSRIHGMPSARHILGSRKDAVVGREPGTSQ